MPPFATLLFFFFTFQNGFGSGQRELDMSKTKNTIPVLDSDNRLISKTTPAKARILLKSGKCSVFSDNPFMIKQNGELKDNMVKRQTRSYSNFVTNWTKFFAEESEIYVQNLTSTNIALTLMQDGMAMPVCIPCTRKPLNLTQFATFDSIKNSIELRRLANRKPPALRLVDQEEYEKYYEDLADKYGTDVEDEMREAQDQFSALMNKRTYSPADMQRDMEKTADQIEEDMMTAKEPDPRVIGLCEKSDKDYGNDRLTQRQILEELEIMENELTVEDWDYVSSRISSGYKQVKDFALEMIRKSN